MDTKYLNLDEVADVEVRKVIKIDGEDHEFVPLTVGAFIKQEQLSAKLARLGDDAPLSDVLGTMVDMVALVFPGCPREKLEALSFRKLNAIIEFTRAEVPEEVKREAAEGNG